MTLSIQDLSTSNVQPSIDWTTNKFVNETTSNTTIKKVDMISGAVGSPTTIASITGHVGDGTVNNIIVSDQGGNLYFGSGTVGDRYCPVTKITEALALVYTAGSASVGGPPGTDGLNDPAGLTVIKGHASWIVSVGDDVLAPQTIQINRADTGAYVVGNNSGSSTYTGPPTGNHAWILDEAYNPFVSPGAVLKNGSLATAYIIAPSATVLGFYCAGVYDLVPASPQYFFAKIGTLVPGDIDLDWATLDFGDLVLGLFASGIAVDQFDNGMITFVAVTKSSMTYGAGTTYASGDVVWDGGSLNYVSLQDGNVGHNQGLSPTWWRPIQMQYCIKVNAGPYSVSGLGSFGLAWKIPVNTMPQQYNVLGQSSIKHIQYLYVENAISDSTAFVINTIDGSYKKIAIPGVTIGPGYQASEDTLNSIVTTVNYNAAIGGAPTGLNGTTTFSNHWARIYLGLPPFVPPAPGPSPVEGQAFPGSLIGATYRRVSAFTTEAPAFVGWHRHDFGHQRLVTSIGSTPSGDTSGLIDNLDFVSTDGSNYFVEGLTQIFDEDDVLTDGWFVDGGLVPDSAYADTVSSVTGIRFTGLWWLIGKTLAVVAFGLDLGNYTVDANGTVFVPYGSGVAPASFDYTVAGAGHYLFTAAYITSNLLTVAGRNGGVPYGGKFMPCCVGYTYTSQGQMLRPATPETGGSRAGPTMGKKRRSHLFTGLFHNTIGVQVGTDFANKLLPANFKNDGDVLTPPNQMYSGTWRDTVIDDYDFDSMITWQILRPYPASVVSIGAMIKTQDV